MTHDPRTAFDRLFAPRATPAALRESFDLSAAGWWPPLTPQDYGIGDDPRFWPMGAGSYGLGWLDRGKRGADVPAYLTESQLRIIRKQIRATCEVSEAAKNVVKLHRSYAVGEGLRYEAVAKPGRDPALAEQAQVWIDAFVEANELALREGEVVRRLLIDGEAFLRLFPRGDGLLVVRAVEPEHVWSPRGDGDDDSFGVRSAPNDVESVEGYWVIVGDPDRGATPELVPAEEIVHFKQPETPSTSKRGLSMFYPIAGDLKDVEDLRASAAAQMKARGKIAWIETFEGTPADAVEALVARNAAATATDPATGQNVTMERYRPGSVLRRPAGTGFEMPSAAVAAGDHVEIMGMMLRNIAMRFSMPEYMLSSDASNANYSSTLVAESPWVKEMQAWQDTLGRLFGRNRFAGHRRSLVWRQLAHAVAEGHLPREVFRAVDVQVTGPSLTVRDVGKEAQVDQVYHGLGIKSKTTIQLEQGLDPDTERENLKKEQAEGRAADPGQLPSVPGMNGQEQADPAAGEAAPLGESFTPEHWQEARLLEAKLGLGPKPAKEARKVGEVWRGPSGRYFTKRQDGRVVPAKAPQGQQASGEKKPATKPAAAPKKATAKLAAPKKAPAAKKPAAPKKEKPAPQASEPAKAAVLKALGADPVASLAELRSKVPAKYRGKAFDAAALALHDAGLIQLNADADPAQVAGGVEDGATVFSTAMPTGKTPKPAPAKKAAAPKEAPPPEKKAAVAPAPAPAPAPASPPAAAPAAKAGGLTRDALLDAVRKAPGLAGPARAVRDLLARHSADAGDAQLHGMKKAERMRGVDIGGMQVLWPAARPAGGGPEGLMLAAESIARALSDGDMPEALWRASGRLVFTSQRNKDDGFWERRFGMKGFRAKATGGDGAVVVYGGGSATAGEFAHESGHNLAARLWGTDEPPAGSAYGRAQAAEPPVTPYGAKAASEDFAEACRLYSTPGAQGRDRLRAEFPRKFAALEATLQARQ